MERKVTLKKEIFFLQSLSPNTDGGSTITYWVGEIGFSDLKQIIINDYIVLKTSNLEIIKIMA